MQNISHELHRFARTFLNQSVKIREIGGKMLLPYEQQELVGKHQV